MKVGSLFRDVFGPRSSHTEHGLRSRIARVRIETWILVVILAAALILRIWGIGFGLPFVYHYDEHFYINTALNLGAGVMHNPPYAPVGLSNFLFGEYTIYYLLGWLSGAFATPQAFEAAFRADPTVVYTLARLTTALFGTLAVAAVFLMGRHTFGVWVGLVAAGFMAANFLQVRDSHYAVPDVPMSCGVALAVGLASVGLHTGKLRYVQASALVGGLAIALKWTAIPVVAPIGWAAILVIDQRSGSIVKKLGNPKLLSVGLLCGLGFALGSPQVLLNPVPYFSEAMGQYNSGRAGGFDFWQVDTVTGWCFYLKVLLQGAGVIIFALAGLGLLKAVIRPARVGAVVLLLLFPMLYYLAMGATRHYFARYTLPMIPFMMLFAGIGVVQLVSWIVKSEKRYIPLLVVTGTVAAILPLARSLRSDLLLSREDTRTLAKRWIESAIPAGARIAVDWPVHTPPLATSERTVPDSKRVYDVYEVGGLGLSTHPATWYQSEAFDYLITSSFIYDIPLVQRDLDQTRTAFYRSLDDLLPLVKTFYPCDDPSELPFVFDEIYGPIVGLWRRERPGPVIKIYAIPSSVQAPYESAAPARASMEQATPDALDWSQVQGNPQRTGFSAETLGTTITVAWVHTFHPERVHPQAQTIVYGGNVFVGTEAGNVYALDAHSGALSWRYDVGAPVLNSVGAADGLVIFGAMDGAVYALDAGQGNLVWRMTFSTPASFSTAPLLAEGKVMLGSREGHFYGLDIASGAVLWDYDVGSPLLQTAAWNEGRAYFGAMDMHVYAINTGNGTLVWRSERIPGMAFKDYWPVVHQGRVLVRAMAAENNFHALDETTGAETLMLPQFDGKTQHGATAPPAVDRDGYLIVPIPRPGSYGACWGRLNLSSQAIVDTLEAGSCGNNDENENVTCAQTMIIGLHTIDQLGAGFNGVFDYDLRQWRSLSSGVDFQPRYNTQGGGGNPASIADGFFYHISLGYLIARSAGP